MNRGTVSGAVLTAAGLGGYLLGVVMAYPGRAFALTLVMVGVTLLAMRATFDAEAVGP